MQRSSFSAPDGAVELSTVRISLRSATVYVEKLQRQKVVGTPSRRRPASKAATVELAMRARSGWRNGIDNVPRREDGRDLKFGMRSLRVVRGCKVLYLELLLRSMGEGSRGRTNFARTLEEKEKHILLEIIDAWKSHRLPPANIQRQLLQQDW